MEPRENTTVGMFNLADAWTEFSRKHADHRTDGFPFLNSLRFQLGVSALYLLFVLYLGPRYMATRKPFQLRTTIRLYNVFQILACAHIIYQSIANKWSFRRALFTTCYPLDPNPEDPSILNIVAIFYFTYLVKLSELVETVFFILRKKYNQVSSLHLYHHVSTLYIVWWGARFYPGGLALFPVILNSFVHILMYTYYLIANLGPKWQTWVAPVKPYITIIQMAQFTLLILLSFVLLSPYYCAAGPRTFGYIFLPNVILVYYLFYQFFKRTYLGSDHPNSGKVHPSSGTAEKHKEVYDRVRAQVAKKAKSKAC